MSGIIRGDAARIPLRDGSVDLVVTSPPYFAQRSYKDGGEHYDGQVGSEPHPREFLEALWGVMAECWRVLKPTGSAFVNLGDKRSGSGGHNNASLVAPGNKHARVAADHAVEGEVIDPNRSSRRNAPDRYIKAAFGRPKSRQALPERFVIGCEDGEADPEGIGWIYRQQLIWEKPNGLPESVRDRTRDSFEAWFHLTREGNYYSAIDELRESYDPASLERYASGPMPVTPAERRIDKGDGYIDENRAANPLGKLPGSVWRIPTEALTVPEHLGVDHFAAFPTEWPRRLILGWSPSAICLECGQGRVPVTDHEYELDHVQDSVKGSGRRDGDEPEGNGRGINAREGRVVSSSRVQILGHACACTPYTDHAERRGKSYVDHAEGYGTAGRTANGAERSKAYREGDVRPPVREYHLDGWTAPPTRPAIVLDPFGGTGTTAMVARALGRVGVSLDLSSDYCRLARWRVFESGHGAKVRSRYDRELQGVLL